MFLLCQAVIYAATCDWSTDLRKKNGSSLLPHDDLRYYARGVFAWPQVCIAAHEQEQQLYVQRLMCSSCMYISCMCSFGQLLAMLVSKHHSVMTPQCRSIRKVPLKLVLQTNIAKSKASQKSDLYY